MCRLYVTSNAECKTRIEKKAIVIVAKSNERTVDVFFVFEVLISFYGGQTRREVWPIRLMDL